MRSADEGENQGRPDLDQTSGNRRHMRSIARDTPVGDDPTDPRRDRALLAMVGLGASLGITIGVFVGRPSEETGHWGHIGTALGFVVGIPVGVAVVLLLSN